MSIDAAPDLAIQAERVPGVARAAPAADGYLVPEGRLEDFYGGVILPLVPGALDDFWRPVLTAGRQADRERSTRWSSTSCSVSIAELGVGDRFVLVDPLGLIRQPVTIVGFGVFPNDFTFGAGSPLDYPTDAFARAGTASYGPFSIVPVPTRSAPPCSSPATVSSAPTSSGPG